MSSFHCYTFFCLRERANWRKRERGEERAKRVGEQIAPPINFRKSGKGNSEADYFVHNILNI